MLSSWRRESGSLFFFTCSGRTALGLGGARRALAYDMVGCFTKFGAPWEGSIGGCGGGGGGGCSCCFLLDRGGNWCWRELRLCGCACCAAAGSPFACSSGCRWTLEAAGGKTDTVNKRAETCWRNREAAGSNWNHYLEGRGAGLGCLLRCMECCEMELDPHRYWARGDRGRGSCRSRAGAADAASAGDPVVLADRGGHWGCWLETFHLGSWRRCGADRGAGLDLWVHTVQGAGGWTRRRRGFMISCVNWISQPNINTKNILSTTHGHAAYKK